MVLVALAAAGMAGNQFGFTLFNRVDFIFGSIFALLALQLFGPWLGLACALLNSLPLVALWGHPYVMIIMALEVGVVGWLTRKHGRSLLHADALYWVLVGMPLVYVFYHFVMKTPPASAYFLMAKDTVNGITNALVARFLLFGLSARSRKATISFRELLNNLLVLFVLIPGLVLIGVESRQDWKRVDQQVRANLIQDGAQVLFKVDTWLKNRQAGLAYLAGAAAYHSAQAMQPDLEQAIQSDCNFLRMGILNQEGVTVAYSPLQDAAGQSNLGRDLADRPYLPRLKASLRPILSEVILARLGTPAPVVVMAVPVLKQGHYGGCVTGVLDLQQIRDNLRQHLEAHGTRYTLLDRNGMIILSSQSEQKVMGPLVREPGTLDHFDGRVSQWLPALRPNRPAMERWARSSYVAAFAVGPLAGWQLLLEQPVAPIHRQLIDRYAQKLTLLLLMMLGALAVAEAVSRKLSRSFEQLVVLTHDLPAKVASGTAPLLWTPSRFLEASALSANFKTMATSLAEQFDQVRQANAVLEQRVAERSRDAQASEAKLRLLLERAPLGIAVVASASGRFEYVNPRLGAMLGFEREELLAGTFQHFTHPEHLEADLASVEALASGRVQEIEREKRYVHRSGATVWARLKMVRLPAPEGEAQRHLTLVEDISERKRAEAALQDREARYSALFELSPDGISVTRGEDGVLLAVNKAWLSLFGFTAEEVVGQTTGGLGLYAKPLDRERLFGGLPETGCLEAFTLDLVRKDGSLFVAELTARLLDIDGERCLLAVLRDVTEDVAVKRALQESEQRFRTLAEESPAALFLHRDDRFVYANAAGVQLLRGQAVQEIIGRKVLDHVHPDDREQVQARIRVAKDRGEDLLRAEERLLALDGSVVEAAVVGRAVTFEGLPTILVFAQDISPQRRALENELRARKAESLVLMAGGIAHDFNNLFQALVSSMGILEFKCRTLPDVTQAIGTAKLVLERAIRLSWKMLDFSGRAVARLKLVALEELVTSWAGALDASVRAQRLVLELEPVPMVQGDPGKLLKVLDDLLENALEAMAGLPSGRIRVRVLLDRAQAPAAGAPLGFWVAERPAGPETVCLAFSNDGPDPAPEVLAKMFDPFFTTKAVGRGLGLPSVLGILQAHGAGLNVVRDAAFGLTFRLYFPAPRAEPGR